MWNGNLESDLNWDSIPGKTPFSTSQATQHMAKQKNKTIKNLSEPHIFQYSVKSREEIPTASKHVHPLGLWHIFFYFKVRL